jgi:hypothetical protein
MNKHYTSAGMPKRSPSFHLIQWPGWLLVAYLVIAQAVPAFDYELGVKMGTQESAEIITEVGAAFWYGFAFADLVFYIPLMITGLVGHAGNKSWHPVVLGAALGVTIYWPITALATVVAADSAPGWRLDDVSIYWIVLPLVIAWAAWCLFVVAADALPVAGKGDD